MYIPKQHEETRVEVMHALIASQPLGTWTVLGQGELITNHLPFQIDPHSGPLGTLRGHIARANPVWQAPPTHVLSSVAFHGPQAYISPSWYPSKEEHGRAVPTWNYVVVHAAGTPRFIEDRDWLIDQVSKLTDAHESNRLPPWSVADAPADYIDKMLAAIIGVEIPIERLTGKWKISQNRPLEDQLGVIEGLHKQNEMQSAAIADLIQRRTSN